MKAQWIFALVLLLPHLLFSQRITHVYRIIDEGTGKPIKNVSVSGRLDYWYGYTNNDGYIKFETKEDIDSINIQHIAYKSVTTKISEEGTIYMKKNIEFLGTLKMYETNTDTLLICDEILQIPKPVKNIMSNEFPKFPGGLLCFDAYVLREIKKLYLDFAILPKQVPIHFTLETDGKLREVRIEKEIPEGIKNALIRIFLDCPLWIPARVSDEYVPLLCKYYIRFRQ